MKTSFQFSDFGEFRPAVFSFQWGILIAMALLAGCAAAADPPPAAQPSVASATPAADSQAPTDSQTWQTIAKTLGHSGVVKDHVYVVTIPRDDLNVTIDGMPIPTAAGLESQFRFYRCPCGKLNVVGQFCVTDYESNDVAAALMNARFDVPSMSPMFLYDTPRLMILRFQGEGSPQDLGKTLHDALTWMGPERTMPQTKP
jgi:hypothetical protein